MYNIDFVTSPSLYHNYSFLGNTNHYSSLLIYFDHLHAGNKFLFYIVCHRWL